MPCHVDPILPQEAKKQIDFLVDVNAESGSIRFVEYNNTDDGNYPTIEYLVAKAKTKYKTFRYEVHGTKFVIVHPCPKKC